MATAAASPAVGLKKKGRTPVPRTRPTRSERRRNLTGWVFIIPAAGLITIMSFWPMLQALLLSLQTGRGTRLHYAEPLWLNYERLLNDEIFIMTLRTTFVYLIIQVPLMLGTALVLSVLLNNPNLKLKGLFRTAIFLPCAVSLVSYSLVFRTLFTNDGFVNDMLMGLGLIDSPVNWLGNTMTARMVIILGLLWRWTGYNMVFYLAGLQNIDPSTIEAARIDGANAWQTFWHVTVPQLKPMILLTAIMSTNGTLQLFDESWNLTRGGPAYTSMTMSHYLYELSFLKSPNFGYASALSYVILALVAVLALIQMKVGDKRDA
ncbi:MULTISPECIES: sugar ABC transporter permease [unclassified Actinomyces]|uniref:carbohydrate ABC transporter permease n=1 Tax=unclassified Actinomyces TaxID=2609248 RepID=UPI002017A2DA|nr:MULTISPECIES: sugar ABC transporter permease [unclassified Actinomyces]MCL3777111.1 sugar ABC transporter permease [Actinomyces sp. AC-20-1]MCL3788973.1 sugar ABC transporter permease [Actinomyces sp. 187325]MCL3791297.1 sugar ABC transporter permease [Actinomyces sp. 186855]MCL3795379.1 sugar ABC transporter permease [Actinomyces sp. 217892]